MPLKEKPAAIPNLQQIVSFMDATEKTHVTLIRQHFDAKTFVGRLVTNWCGFCGRWRINYFSSERAKIVSPQDCFPCTTCGRQLQLLVDGQHTLLKNA
jgi:hypothetical protein